MTEYILILVMMTTTGYATAPAPVGVLFPSKEACEGAASQLAAEFTGPWKLTSRSTEARAICVPRGNP